MAWNIFPKVVSILGESENYNFGRWRILKPVISRVAAAARARCDAGREYCEHLVRQTQCKLAICGGEYRSGNL